MICSHDIPEGAKLYFGKKAKIKREIEHIASEVFENFDFEEIVSPFFSYHQLEALNEKELIKFTDKENRILSLRGDSSIDIIRIVLKRLKSQAKKWFYIQPVFRYPSTEINQIGAEWLEGDLKNIIDINLTILNRLNKNYPIIISHSLIAKAVLEKTNLTVEDIEKMKIYKFPNWLKELISISKVEDIKYKFDDEINNYLKEIKEIAEINENSIIAPLYLTQLKYYTGVFYRVIKDNKIIAKGGEYKVENINSVGFSIYTDNLIDKIND